MKMLSLREVKEPGQGPRSSGQQRLGFELGRVPVEKTWHTPIEAIQGDVLLFKKGLVTKAWQVCSSNSRLVSTQPSLSPGTRNKGREVRTDLFRAGAVREGIVTFR